MRKKIRLLCFVVVLSVLVTLITGCGGGAMTTEPAVQPTEPAVQPTEPAVQPTEPAVQPTEPAVTPEPVRTTSKDILILANINDVGTLDPFADTAMQRRRVTDQIYEPLFYMQPDGTFAPALATAWEWVDDTHLRITLQQNVKFHNGASFTAEDVLYSLGIAKASKTGANYGKFDLDNSLAVDDYMVELAFTEIDAVAQSYLGTNLVMLDKQTVEADPTKLASEANGTGPYKLVEWITGDSVNLEKFDEYWGVPAIIKTLIFRNVSELTQRSIELQTGGVDFAFDMGATSVSTIESDPNLAVLKQPSPLVANIIFNTREGHVFANEDLRKAAASAISVQDIIQGAYDGNGTVPFSYVSSAVPGYDTTLAGEPWPQDLTAAQTFFASSGIAAGTEIKIVVDDRAQRIATAEIVKNQLAQIGLEATIQQYDFGTAIGIARDPVGDWDIYFLSNGGGTATIQSTWLNGKAAPFITFPQTPDGAELLVLVNDLAGTLDPAESQELNNQIQAYVNEHVVLYPAVQDQVLYGYNKNLTGVPEGILGLVVLFKDVYFK